MPVGRGALRRGPVLLRASSASAEAAWSARRGASEARRRCPPVFFGSSSFSSRLDSEPTALASAGIAGVGAVEAGVAAAEVPAAPEIVFDAVRERHEGAAEVAVLVEAVERGRSCCRSVRPARPSLGSSAGLVVKPASSRSGTTPDFAEFAGLADDRCRLRAKIGPEASPASPRLFSATVVACENGVSVRVASVSEGAALPRSSNTGVPASEKPLQVGHRGPELAQEGGELLQRLFQFGAVFGARLGGGAGVGEEAGDVRRSRASGSRIASESLASWASWSRWSERMPNSVSTSRRTGLARLTSDLEVAAAAGEAGAEFVEDQPEALRVGQRLDVVDQVRVDAGAVAAERQQVLARARLRRSGICFSGGGACAPGARGRVGRQSTNFSPISDCGRIWQLASARKSWKPGSVISISMIALPGTATGLPSS